MLFAEVLNRLADDAVAEEAILSVGNLVMLVTLREQATAEGTALGEYTAATVCRYLSTAPDEEWISLMGAMERTSDPGAACLRRAFAHAVGA